ncbi:putative MFS family arabinose efflux permease [Nocardioides albertanoniae]|uniref:Putative MFS family arabinose efflux permease n=1 Tax=Nocardioides albertanoniae TaxID=1175486 RepID=A0A543A7J5_9ACTN|nr:MFS transporter [Nocardioides albertanoniae]TQL68571.1 putative MFS family arabinose efflux permease [Nocardioides albertanoniae]
MSHITAERPEVDARTMRRVATASLTGTTIEFYDFLIYGLAAALVFNAIFFPSMGGPEGTLASIATFGVAFVFRPLGAILFGHYGDRIGRKATLITTLMIMGTSTFAIGLIPSVESIGKSAVVILVLLRALQGIALGGEWAGAALLTTEYAAHGKRGRYSMFPQLGPSLGLIIAAAAMLTTFRLMAPEAFAAWGWRIPFLASAVLVAVGLWVRLKVAETPSFKKVQSAGARSALPFLGCLRDQWRQVLLGGGIMAIVFGAFYTGASFMVAHAVGSLGLSMTQALLGVIVAAFAMSLTVIASAWLSDVFGRRMVLLVGAGFGVIAGPLAFGVMEPGSFAGFALGNSLLLCVLGLNYGPIAAFLPEMFHARYRYTGAGLGYNIAGILGGAVPLVIAEDLLARWGTDGIAYFLTALALLSVVCLLVAKETSRVALDADPAIA